MRPPLRLILAADFHLGAPFAFLDPEAAQTMRQRQLQVLRDLCQLAAERKTDFFLIAGDLFDSPVPDKALLRLAQQSFALCPQCHVVICPGNHDPYYPASFWDDAGWPAHVRIVRPDQLFLEFPDKGLRVYSAPFLARSSARAIFPLQTLAFEGEWSRILLLHGELVSGGGSSRYNPISRDWLRHSGFDLAVLGHIHQRSELVAESGCTPYLYPGCPLGRGFDESGECGCYIGDFYSADPDRGLPSETALRFRPSGKGKFQRLRVPLDGLLAEDQDELAEFLRQQIIRAAGGVSSLRRDALELTLCGRSEWRPDPDYLSRVLQDLCFYLKIQDESSAPSPFQPQSNEKSLRAYLAAVLREARESGREEESVLEESERLLAEALEGELTPHATS